LKHTYHWCVFFFTYCPRWDPL